MSALSLRIHGKASSWLRRRSRELGVTPEAVVEDLIAGREAAEAFRALSEEVGAHAAARGLTTETLTELLDGETYE